jgi:predicted NBD/HSP70 family sugar kinase
VAAQAILDRVARQLARAVATLGAVIAPEVVILGGSIGARPEIIAATKAELARCFPFPVCVVASLLGNRAVLSGAVATGLRELYTTFFAQSAAGAIVSLPVPKPGLI